MNQYSGCMLIASKIHDVSPMKTEQFTYLSADSYTEYQIVKMEQKICSTLRFHLQIATPCHFAHRFLRASYISSNQYHHPYAAAALRPPACSFSWENDTMRFMVDYLLELAMLEYHCVYWEPSVVAASAVYLARATLNIRDEVEVNRESSDTNNNNNNNNTKNSKSDEDDTTASEPKRSHEQTYGYYSKTLEHYTGHKLEYIVEVINMLHEAQKKQCQHRGVVNNSTSSLKAVYDKYSSEKYKRVALKAPVEDRVLLPLHLNGLDADDEDIDDDDDDDNEEEEDSEEDDNESEEEEEEMF